MRIRSALALTTMVAVLLVGCATAEPEPTDPTTTDTTTTDPTTTDPISPGDPGGGDEGARPAPEIPDRDEAETFLRIGSSDTVTEGEPTVLEPGWTVTCGPVGGTHPDAEAVCALLDAEGEALFEPVPADAVCTDIFGGPEVVHVSGWLDGESIDATFTRTNGCEIDRWDAASLLIGGPGL